MFTSFTSKEVSLICAALNLAHNNGSPFDKVDLFILDSLRDRLQKELAKHETTPIIESAHRSDLTSEYRVVWEIDIDATSPSAAAERAREIQMDPYNIASIYTVYSRQGVEPYVVELPPTPEPGPAPVLKLSDTMREVAIERDPPTTTPEPDPHVDSMCDAYMICAGNPADGFRYYGPFHDMEAAEEWAGDRTSGSWWVIELVNPGT